MDLKIKKNILFKNSIDNTLLRNANIFKNVHKPFPNNNISLYY